MTINGSGVGWRMVSVWQEPDLPLARDCPRGARRAQTVAAGD
jgi:hypothetical protein